MANEKNLIPFDERTESEQREIARLFSAEIEYSEDNLYDVMGLFS